MTSLKVYFPMGQANHLFSKLLYHFDIANIQQTFTNCSLDFLDITLSIQIKMFPRVLSQKYTNKMCLFYCFYLSIPSRRLHIEIKIQNKKLTIFEKTKNKSTNKSIQQK